MILALNYWAILVAAIVSMIIGFVWYGPLFGRSWARLMGLNFESKEAKKEMQKKAISGYICSFIGALVMAVILANVVILSTAYPGTTGAVAGLLDGFLMWLGFVVPVTIGSVFWEKRPWKLWVINAGYWLVLLLVMGKILAIWQ